MMGINGWNVHIQLNAWQLLYLLEKTVKCKITPLTLTDLNLTHTDGGLVLFNVVGVVAESELGWQQQHMQGQLQDAIYPLYL